ncbi:MAG: GGDEF domain-containing protein [Pseudoxanthomonas sp.]
MRASGAGALSVGFLDIDLFKRINDVHGHAVGDRVLVAVAGTLTSAVRTPADVIRMGGEEFLVLLPGVGGDAARGAPGADARAGQRRRRRSGDPGPGGDRQHRPGRVHARR